MTRSHSSGLDRPFLFKFREWLTLFGHCIRESYDAGTLFDDIEAYRFYLSKFSGKKLESSKVFEIGFGAFPFKMIALMSMGVDVKGIDMDQPVLDASWNEFLEMYRRNGVERFVKSLVRYILFDHKTRADLKRRITDRGHVMHIDKERFMVGDVGELDLEEESLDFIFSEDTFEHIPRATIEALMPKMRRWLKKDGIIAVRPCVFSGITGGHLVGWYVYDVLHDKTGALAEPWEHLRKQRYTANTYLNRLNLDDYRKLFLRDFDILEEKAKWPGLGKTFLTPQIRAELRDLTDEDLLTNQVLFILRPR